LLEKTGALDVYFEDSMQILVSEMDTFSVETLESVLKEKQIAFTTIERGAGL